MKKHSPFFLVMGLLLFVSNVLFVKSVEAQDRYNYKKLPELQRAFINTRYQAYFHFNMCTFKNAHEKEYQGRSRGTEPASMYNPPSVDCEQWAQVCKEAHMAGGWLTTKHHGGFCLWPSAFTDYDVASSGNKTDVVGAFVKAFRKAGLKVGLYYSILDYHHGVEQGSVTTQEVQFLKNQITELLTNYGPIDYINFDGWSTWPTTPNFDDVNYGEILRLVKSLQPNCLIVSHTYESNLAHAEIPFADAAGRDYPYHPEYMRPCAASDALQHSWWWDADQTQLNSLKYTLGKLNSYNSHNAVYILNIAPTTEGKIEQEAIDRLKEIAAQWKKPAAIERAGDDWGYSYDVNTNLAFMRPAVQSSTDTYIRDKRAYPRAEIALDGVTEGRTEMEQTSLTQREDNPWWRVDLGKTEELHSITIYTSTDTYKDQLQNYTVTVLDAAGNEVWKSVQKTCPSPSVTLKVGKKQGRFVKIQLKGRGYLALAEVIVH